MSIKKYTNIDGLNNKTSNDGHFQQAEDLFIISKSEIDTTDFGDCKYDVMEISVYDINNNLLPQKSGNNVAYIKTDDIKNYMYQIINKQGLKELAIDIEKLLKYLGFTNIRTKIFTDFKTSIEYYLTNKYYDITQSTFGKPSNIRFEDYDIYDFNNILNETQNILYKCVDINLKSLKRRDIGLKNLPKEFAITELQKQIKNNLDSFSTYSETKRNVYSPDGTLTIFNDTNTGFTEPTYIVRGTLIKTMCKGYDQYGAYADGNGGTYDELIQVNSSICGYVIPDIGNGGTGGDTGGGGTGGRSRGGGSSGLNGDEYRNDNQK